MIADRAEVTQPVSTAHLVTRILAHLHTILLFFGFLALYMLTLAPGMLPADAGEFQLTGALLGVAHPPGFALYTLAGWLISRVPFVAPATAINLLSALLAAGTLALVSRTVQEVTGSRAAGVCAALALGFSTTFWAQATTANIRMPAAFATALALERVVVYRNLVGPGAAVPLRASGGQAGMERRRDTVLASVALALGLGVSHHASLVFIAAVLGLYTLWLEPRVLSRPWPLLAGLLPFAAWAYFPLRAEAFGAPPRIATLGGFLEHILALGFSGDFFFFANAAVLPGRLRVLANILTFEFTWPLLALALVGMGALLMPRGAHASRDLGTVLGLALLAHSFVAITYRAPQTVEYLLPSYVLMAVLMGYGAAWLLRKGREKDAVPWRAAVKVSREGLAGAVLLVVLAAQFGATFPSYWSLAREESARAYAAGVLEAAPRGAVVLASWHWATPLWYLQEVEGKRLDVHVEYVFPRGESLAQNWAEAIRDNLGVRPVVVTSFYPQEFGALPYRFVPLGRAWTVRTQPVMEAPEGLAGAQTFEAWEFLGYALLEGQAEVRPAGTLEVVAAWQPRARTAPHDIHFFVHLLGPGGELAGQMDVSYLAGRYEPEEILIDRYTIALRPDAPAGDYRLVAGAYLPDGTRLAEAPMFAVRVRAPRLGTARVPEGAIPFGGAVLLTGSEIAPGGPVQPGDHVDVTLHFLAARPITEDYVVKVDVIGSDWRWRAQSDAIPAGGAIPTLKWIAGSRVTDQHTLTIPAGAVPGQALVVLALYDFFTGRDLAILDPALAALGPTVPLGTVEVAGR